MMRETISHESQFTLLNVLLDGIEILVFRNLLFGIGPTGDFNDHIEDLRTRSGRRCEKGDIVPWGDDDTVLLEINTMLKSMGSPYVK